MRLPGVFCILMCLLLWSTTASARDLKVFILHSYHQEYQWTSSQHAGFVEKLNGELPEWSISYATEYLDTKRVKLTGDYALFFRDYLRRKYIGYTPDIIFSTDDDSLDFLRTHSGEIFPDVPVVFCGVNNIEIGEGLDRRLITGVYEVKDVSRNLFLIERLLPAAGQVFIVGDNSVTDMAIRSDVEHHMKNSQSSVNYEVIGNESLSELLSELRRRQKGIVLLTTIGGLHDQDGQAVPLKTSIEAIKAAGEFVIFSMEDAYMMDGVLGGYVTSGRAQGAAAARLVRRIVSHNALVSGFLPVPGPSVAIFDHREIERLRIDTERLPQGSIILNQPRSLYDEFREIIWATVTVVVALLFLLLVLSVNILRRKSAEKALAESERFLDSVIENIPDMIFVKRAEDLCFVRVNKVGEDMIGVGRDEMLGKNDYDIFPPEKADFFTIKDREALNGKKLVDIPEESIEIPAGTRYLHTKKIPILNQQGEPAFLLGISRDITAEKEEKQHRRELEERLLQAEKMESIGTLAGGIAHDFNNILSSIIGYTELAWLDAEDPHKVRSYLDGTLKGTERAKDLIRQILTFSRKGNQQKIPLQLQDVARDAIKMLRSTLPATISIEENLASDAIIMADPTQVQQIILNLCTNAYHAMLASGGTLGVSLQEVDVNKAEELRLQQMHSGNYLRLEVGDTGKGMDAETQQRMFDPYYTTKGPEAGTGLGLAMVHGIVKSHNAHIHVYSEVGVGTTVHVCFPILREPEAERSTAKNRAIIHGGTEHVLLVDDEQDIIATTKDLLVRNGYRVTSSTDSIEALSLLRQQPEEFDLLLTDMTMPGLTGAELAVQAIETVPGLPVILCSGYSEIINRENALAMGIRAYCEKPVSAGDLLHKLREVLDGRNVNLCELLHHA